jgi:GT2 family glycosyltransferase
MLFCESSVMKCPVSVVIPTFNRSKRLIATIEEMLSCEPAPDEIVIHIDGNDRKTETATKQQFGEISAVKVLISPTRLGPGGGRNVLLKAARNEIVASFDDDSYPIDKDYFARLLKTFQIYPDASIVAGAIYHQGEPIKDDLKCASWVASFVGCGCAYRKSDFLKTDGYLNLPLAYGAEEVDLAIQLYAKGKKILQTDWLRVYHDTAHEHHKDREINAASISNLALLAYMRYPSSMAALGLVQVFNRVSYSFQKRRYEGIGLGLLSIPNKLWSNRRHRQPVSPAVMQQYLRLRKQSILIPWQE